MATARILIVDDEPSLVKLASRALVTRGYEVVSATDPREALEAIQCDPAPDLVISDVMMPQMSGPELIQEIHRIRPKIATMLITGYAGELELPAGVPLLLKPFSMDKLFRKVEEVLAAAMEARVDLSSGIKASQQLRRQSERLREESSELKQRARAACQRSKELLGLD